MVKAIRSGTKPDFSQYFQPFNNLSIGTSQIRHTSLSQEGANNVVSKREAHVVCQDTDVEDSTVCSYVSEGNLLQQDETQRLGCAGAVGIGDISTRRDRSARDITSRSTESIVDDRMCQRSHDENGKPLAELGFIKGGDDPLEVQDAFLLRKSIHDRHHENRRLSTDGPFTSGHVCYPSAVTSDVKEEMTPYLGQVLIRGEFVGTCLAIGEPEHPCVITCYHVIERELCQHTLDDVRVHFTDTHRLEFKTLKASVGCDYAVMEVKSEEGLKMPPTWRKFEVLSQNDIPLYVLGFQSGNLQIDDTAVILNNCPYNLVDKAQKMIGGYSDLLTRNGDSICSGKTLVQSSILHGGSGGVGVIFDENKELQVVLMFQRGFPNEYYMFMDWRQKKDFQSEYLTEQGMTFSEIYDDMSDIDTFRSHITEYMSADILLRGLCVKDTT